MVINCSAEYFSPFQLFSFSNLLQGWCTKADAATWVQADVLSQPDTRNLLGRKAENHRGGCRGNVGQRKNLAEHALVQLASKLRQVAVALVLHAFRARRRVHLPLCMDVERREKKHRQIHCQQQPSSNMSLLHHVHGYKNTTFISNKELHIT